MFLEQTVLKHNSMFGSELDDRCERGDDDGLWTGDQTAAENQLAALILPQLVTN